MQPVWWRKNRDQSDTTQDATFFQAVENEFLQQRADTTKAAVSVLNNVTLREASLDEIRGSLRLRTEHGAVVIATDCTAEAREILSMLALEQVSVIAGERGGRIRVVARSASWSYGLTGIVSLCDEVPL